MSRAFVEPIAYCGNIAVAFLSRTYSMEPAEAFSKMVPFEGSCVIIREQFDTVSVHGLWGNFDYQIKQDIINSMRKMGFKYLEYKRASGKTVKLSIQK
jgi:hypothetical protein